MERKERLRQEEGQRQQQKNELKERLQLKEEHRRQQQDNEFKERLQQEEEQRQQRDKERKERLQHEEEQRQIRDKEQRKRLQQGEEHCHQQQEDESMGIMCDDMVYGDSEHERMKRAETLNKGEVRRRAERVHAALECERSKQKSMKQHHRKVANFVQESEYKQHNVIMYYQQDPSAMSLERHGFIVRDHNQYEHRVKAWEINQARDRGRSERSNELKALCKRTEARWREQELVENMRITEALSEDEKCRRGNLLFKKSLDDARQSLLERREAQCEVMIARIEAERQAALRDIANYQAKIKALEKAALKKTRNDEGRHRGKRRDNRSERARREYTMADTSFTRASKDEKSMQEADDVQEQSEALLETSRRKTKRAIESMVYGLATLEDELRCERITLQQRVANEEDHLTLNEGTSTVEPSDNRESNLAAPNFKLEDAELISEAAESGHAGVGLHGRNGSVATSSPNEISKNESRHDVLHDVGVEELKDEPEPVLASEPLEIVDDDVRAAIVVVSMDAYVGVQSSDEANEVDASVASSSTAASKGVSTEEKVHDFAVGDSVEVRDDLNEEWAPGTVLSVDDSGTPEVQKDGYETAYTWTYCQHRTTHGLECSGNSGEGNSKIPKQIRVENSNQFTPGDKVEVRDELDEDWDPGTVLSLDEDGIPVVKKDGYDSAYTWAFCRHSTQGELSSTIHETGKNSKKDDVAATAHPELDACCDDDKSQSSKESASNDTLSSTASSKSLTPPPPAPDAFTSPAAFPRWKANLDDDDEWESGHGGFGTGGKVVPASRRRPSSSAADVVIAVQAKSKLTSKGEITSPSNQRTLAQAELSRLEETLKKAEENAEEAKTEKKPIRVKKYLKEIETLTNQIMKAREDLEKMGGQTRMEGRYVANGLERDTAISSPRTPLAPARARLIGAMKSVRAVKRLTSTSSPASTSAKKPGALPSASIAQEGTTSGDEEVATTPTASDGIEARATGDRGEFKENFDNEIKKTPSSVEKKKSRWVGLFGRVKKK